MMVAVERGDCALGNAEYRLTSLVVYVAFKRRLSKFRFCRMGGLEGVDASQLAIVPSCKPGQLCGSDGCGGECGQGCAENEAAPKAFVLAAVMCV